MLTADEVEKKKNRMLELQRKYRNFNMESCNTMGTYDHITTIFELYELKQLQKEFGQNQTSSFYQIPTVNPCNFNVTPYPYMQNIVDPSQPMQTKVHIFSPGMRSYLALKESKNNYQEFSPEGGGIGAHGKYQLRKPGLTDIGYVNKNGKWLGKNGIYSAQDFYARPDLQEEALDDFMEANYRYLKNYGALNYLDKEIHGKLADFRISETGLLAAAHREGALEVMSYLKALDILPNGQYYMDYSKIHSAELRAKYDHIETRLREFEK